MAMLCIAMLHISFSCRNFGHTISPDRQFPSICWYKTTKLILGRAPQWPHQKKLCEVKQINFWGLWVYFSLCKSCDSLLDRSSTRLHLQKEASSDEEYCKFMPETSDPKIEPKQTQIVVDNRRPITSSRPRYKKENDFEILWIKQDDLTQACSIRSPGKQSQKNTTNAENFTSIFCSN